MAVDSRGIPDTHPRHESLRIRELIVEGVRSGITSPHGLVAHGRGEAFDYLLGEKTHDFARDAIQGAAAALLLADHPVISINGNLAALAGKDAVILATTVGAKIEVNLFHHSDERVDAISHHLTRLGADTVLRPQLDTVIPGLESSRRYANPDGIAKSDVIFVPLEDGDRCQALRAWGKVVITVDLNPLSRTARDATITVVDNVVRTLPLLIRHVKALHGVNKDVLRQYVKSYDNVSNLEQAEGAIRSGSFQSS